MQFIITFEEHARIREWLTQTVYPEVIARQRAAAAEAGRHDPIREAQWDAGYPYAGAVGGALAYQFTPTTLGLVIKVRYGDEFELDLTDYHDW